MDTRTSSRYKVRPAPAAHADELQALIDHAFDAMLLVDSTDRRVTYANASAIGLTERPSSELIGAALQEVLSFQPAIEWASPDTEHARLLPTFSEARVSLPLNGDRILCLEARIIHIDHHGSSVVGIVLRSPASASDHEFIGDTVASQRRDPLTGLADRAFAIARLESLLERQRDGATQFALLFVDLDNFKHINDAWGHPVGDRVLQQVAVRLAQSVGAGNHVARYGGDEFVVILENCDSAEEIDSAIGRIYQAFEAPVRLPDGEACLKVSIGLSRPSPGCCTTEQLINAADRAMYDAKRRAC